jgi:hypothetical protein
VEESPSVTLRALLDIDAASSHPMGLGDVIGDGYLCARSPLFRRLRRQVDELGYAFSAENALRYQTHPMLHLDGILKSRTIPYLPNRWAVEWMDSFRPGYFTTRHLRSAPPTANYLAHESAHAIADDVFRRRVSDADQHRQRVLRFLIPEAFANSIDTLLLTTLPPGEVSECFARLNSYNTMPIAPALLRFRERVLAEIGPVGTFETAVLCFLAANFTFVGATADHGRKIAGLVGFEVGSDGWVAFMGFCRHCYGLNRKFTVLMNEVYLNAHGFTGDMQTITDFCPFETIASSEPLRSVVRELAELATEAV